MGYLQGNITPFEMWIQKKNGSSGKCNRSRQWFII